MVKYPPIRYLFLAPFIAAALVVGLSYTGFLVAYNYFYQDNVSLVLDSASEPFRWVPEHSGEIGYVKISGTVNGTGGVKVYLERDGKRYLIFERPSLEGPSVSGMLVSGGSNPTEPEGDQTNETLPEANITTPRETHPENETQNITAPEANMTENITTEENQSLTNQTFPEGNATVPANETLPEANITTPRETHPENETQNITAPEANMTENITTEENQSLTNQTFPEGNATVPANETLPEATVFRSDCIETCELEGFRDKSYILAFEIDPGTSLIIDTIEYSISIPREIPNATGTGNITEKKANATLPEPPEENMSKATPANLSAPAITVQPAGVMLCKSAAECNQKALSSTSGGIIILDSPLTCGGTCLKFNNSENIIFDCMGRSITGMGTGAGIYLENSSYVIIKNCNVSGFETGIKFDRNSNFNIITNTDASSNAYGIVIPSSVSNIVRSSKKTRITISGR